MLCEAFCVSRVYLTQQFGVECGVFYGNLRLTRLVRNF